MIQADVFEKTPIGWLELERRTNTLSQFARSTLILCDGRRTVLDLVSLLGSFSLLEQSLASLSDRHLIEKIDLSDESAGWIDDYTVSEKTHSGFIVFHEIEADPTIH